MTSILIISKDPDFSEAVAALARRELGVDCYIAADTAEAENWPDAALAVVDGSAPLAISSIAAGSPPIKMRDLLADIRAALAKADSGDWVEIGTWRFSARLKQLTYGKVAASLTDKEIQLLKYLLEAGASVSKETLLKNVWGFENDINTHTLETHIYRLRNKCRELGGEPLIVAVGNGYALKEDE